jgi:thiol:disulfide interchange protein DsbA
MNSAIFRAIHIENRRLTDEADIEKLFGEFGVSAQDFRNTWKSFAVENQMQRARSLTQKYRVKSVPLLVINGKYTTEGPEIRSHDDLLAVTEELVQRERSGTGS